MGILGVVAGLVLLFVVLWDTFETVVLPRTVTRQWRIARFFYINIWTFWRVTARYTSPARRQGLLSAFGPLSLLLLLGFWAYCLIVSFAVIDWGLGSRILGATENRGFGADLYLSGSTFFTLGFGDVTPATSVGKVLAVFEAGVGLGFLAIVIGYLPILYQSFSRREVGISLLDARAGSPPSAGELLRRHAVADKMCALESMLADWEKWAADLLESHLSFPVLAYYRSQHDRESWLAALTMILDTCALLRIELDEAPEWHGTILWQARMTYAMALHAAIDLAVVFNTPPCPPIPDRLPPAMCGQMHSLLVLAGIPLPTESGFYDELTRLRTEYEPYVNALAERLLLTLPPWFMATHQLDNWQTSAWGNRNHF